ncbi:hypothetical protein ACU8KH_02554 [Lachancea thermotolerans]
MCHYATWHYHTPTNRSQSDKNNTRDEHKRKRKDDGELHHQYSSCQIVIGSLVCDSAKLHNDTLSRSDHSGLEKFNQIIMETLAKEFETLSTNDPDSPHQNCTRGLAAPVASTLSLSLSLSLPSHY